MYEYIYIFTCICIYAHIYQGYLSVVILGEYVNLSYNPSVSPWNVVQHKWDLSVVGTWNLFVLCFGERGAPPKEGPKKFQSKQGPNWVPGG